MNVQKIHNFYLIGKRMTPDFKGPKFQSPPPSDWTIENGYISSKNKDPYPNRVYGIGKLSSLVIIFRFRDNDLSYSCSGPLQGVVKITFESPSEQPTLWKSFYYVSPNQAALFKIIPKLTITSPDLLKYSPNTRQCFFESERQLQLFKVKNRLRN